MRTIAEPAGSHSAVADPLTLSASGLELLATASSVLSGYKNDSLSDHSVKRSTAASPEESWVSGPPEFFPDGTDKEVAELMKNKASAAFRPTPSRLSHRSVSRQSVHSLSLIHI